MNVFWISVILSVIAPAISASVDSKLPKIPKDDKHNIFECAEGDQTNWVRLDAETISASAKFGHIVERTITYPSIGTGSYELVCIKVIDQIADGTGGYPDIEQGGLEFRYVIIHLQSQRSRGFKFTVEIHGKPI